MSRPESDIGLRRRLTVRLAPPAIAIAVFIAIVPPALYTVLESSALDRTATLYAHELSERLTAVGLADPTLWTRGAQRYEEVLNEFLPDKEGTVVRILDHEGRAAAGLEYGASVPPARTWRHGVAIGRAPIVFNNRTVGMVQVEMLRLPLFFTAVILLLVCTALGGFLAVLVYGYPVAVVTTMEGRIEELIETIRRSNIELEGQARALSEKNAELDSFVYSVSHDLKAPLVTIQGMAGILAADFGSDLPSEGRHYLERIQANTQQMERLILDLLALSRIGREARAPEPVHLAEIVDDILAELAGPIRTRGIKVTQRDLGTVWAVRVQLTQVLGNLLSNAVKYLGDTPSPSIEIGSVDQGSFVECYVSDNGIGIDPAYHGKIFEIFQRLKEAEAPGTGVGLTIVKKIVEGAGGRIWVESAPGQGATFRFTWPRVPQEIRS